MTIDQLLYFLAVAESGSINSAAQRFFATQQALNASLRKLEEELGCELLSRGYKGVSLTPQGQIFKRYADNITRQYRQAVLELGRYNAQSSQVKGTLSLFAASIFTDLFLPDIIRDFTALYPNATIKIIEVDTENLLSYLMNHYCDLALLSASTDYITDFLPPLEHDHIKRLTLLTDQMVVCVRRDHPLSAQHAVNMDVLSTYYDKKAFKFSLYQIIPMTMREEVYKWSVSNSSNAELHKKLILEDIAMTYMPALAYQYKFDSDTFAAVPFADAQEISHCLLYRDDPQAANHQLISVFVQFLHEYFAYLFGARMAPDPNQ